VFYRYTQGNVGGFYVGAQVVIVEAASLEEAEALARAAGVYFDGVAAGQDCECCGDRWSPYPDEFSTRDEAIASIAAWREPEDGSPVHQVVDRPRDP
jgi:hypothetical protein